MKVSEINYGVIFDALKAYYEVEEDDSVWEILNQADDPIEVIFDALKAYYEVEEDDSVWEILNQADDPIEEIANALKVLGE